MICELLCLSQHTERIIKPYHYLEFFYRVNKYLSIGTPTHSNKQFIILFIILHILFTY